MWNVFKKVWVKGNKSGIHVAWILVSSTRMTWTWLSAIAGEALSFIRDAHNAKHDGRRGVTDSDTLSPSVSSRHPLLSETGRSMIEMLGVLAIIGVLSIAAVAGYRFALLKFRANEVINELNMRAINVSAQMLNTGTVYEKNELIEDGFGDTLTVGFPVETAISDRNTDYFEILVSDIPADLCRQILRDYENPIMIFVNNVRYNADTTICDDETQNALNDMGFIYKNDLGTHEACSEKGYFDEEDFQCHCSGNTYLDIYTNDCLCPAGHVWSAGEGTCIESICPEGQFETLKNGCVPCSDDKTYTIATDERHKQLCEASTCGRIVVGNLCRHSSYICEPGKQFNNPWRDACYNCETEALGGVYIGSDAGSQALCLQCPNHHITANVYCTVNNYCKNQGMFQGVDGGSGYASCYSCNTISAVQIGTHSDDIAACNACQTADGHQLRKAIDGWCYKIICDSGEFKGTDGRCYKCSIQQQIEVSDESGCTDPACGRQEIIQSDKTYCRLNCPIGTHVLLDDGSCYACEERTYFKATAEQCDGCTVHKRSLLHSDDGGKTGTCARNDICVKGEKFMYRYNGYCYSCGDGHPTGNQPLAHEYCEAIGGHIIFDGDYYCVCNAVCPSGQQFINAKGGCRDCSLTDKQKIGTFDIDRQQCLACTTQPRFWAGSYCYRCNSPETPGVTTSEEEDSCNSCAEREVKDGKCILIQ